MRELYLYVEDIYLVSENDRLIPARGRFVLSSKYRKFKEYLINKWKNELPPDWKAIKGKFYVNFMVSTYKDPTNIVKPILDVMQKIGVFTNDRNLIGQLLLNTRPIKKENESIYITVMGE